MLETLKVVTPQVQNPYFVAALVSKIDRGQNLKAELQISKKKGIWNTTFQSHAESEWEIFLRFHQPDQNLLKGFSGYGFYMCVSMVSKSAFSIIRNGQKI